MEEKEKVDQLEEIQENPSETEEAYENKEHKKEKKEKHKKEHESLRKELEELKKENILPHKIEGYNSNSWILMDYLDVIVNIFTEADREHYKLEDLWEKLN